MTNQLFIILTIGISSFCFNCENKNIPKNFVYVEGGTFIMGQSEPEIDINESPAHEVTLSSFYISKYEVTQKEWQQVMEQYHPKYEGDCENCPVSFVAYDEVQTFIQKMCDNTGLKYRLPTEAEWEYAAMGGNKSQNFLYSGSNELDSIAWYQSNSYYKTYPIGQKTPNELGLYDMSGNVEEWCSDWYGTHYYKNSPKVNPKGLNDEDGLNRIFRGGSYASEPEYCRVKNRGGLNPDKGGFSFIGFRLVIEK